MDLVNLAPFIEATLRRKKRVVNCYNNIMICLEPNKTLDFCRKRHWKKTRPKFQSKQRSSKGSRYVHASYEKKALDALQWDFLGIFKIHVTDIQSWRVRHPQLKDHRS